MAAARKFRNQSDTYHIFFTSHGRGNSYPGPEALYDYELFALINHEGQIDNGHYTSFARFQDTVRHPSSHPISSFSSTVA
jgi:ubiquitin C-terminal hydrolase